MFGATVWLMVIAGAILMAIFTGIVLWCQCCRKRSANDKSLPASLPTSLPAGPPDPPRQSITVNLTEEQFGEFLRKITERTARNPPFEEDVDEENDSGSSEQLQQSPGRARHSSQHRRDSHSSSRSGGYGRYRYIFFLTCNVKYYSTFSTKEYWSKSYPQEGRKPDTHRKQVCRL